MESWLLNKKWLFARWCWEIVQQCWEEKEEKTGVILQLKHYSSQLTNLVTNPPESPPSFSTFSSLSLIQPTNTTKCSKSVLSAAAAESRWRCNSRQLIDSATHTHTHTHTLPLSLPYFFSLSLPLCLVASARPVPQLSVTNWCCGTFPFCSLSIKLAERCSTAEFNFTVELGCWLPCQTQINARLTNMDQGTLGWQPASSAGQR